MCTCVHSKNKDLNTKVMKRKSCEREVFLRNSLQKILDQKKKTPKTFYLVPLLLYCDYFKVGMEEKCKDKKALNFINHNKSHLKGIEFLLINVSCLSAANCICCRICETEALALPVLWLPVPDKDTWCQHQALTCLGVKDFKKSYYV